MAGVVVALSNPHGSTQGATHETAVNDVISFPHSRALLTAHAISALLSFVLTTSASICLRTRGDKGRTAELKGLPFVTQQATRETSTSLLG
ncbi:hypothetical protein BJX63DRAFT_401589 [Aspergillus granulosus]|uniref:Uncharacterized protein n=1 Tax=Aspergillus granulosus TaxID=176169 RepID=A0ABR4H598_9EURO